MISKVLHLLVRVPLQMIIAGFLIVFITVMLTFTWIADWIFPESEEEKWKLR